jgi:hypothetical protein
LLSFVCHCPHRGRKMLTTLPPFFFVFLKRHSQGAKDQRARRVQTKDCDGLRRKDLAISVLWRVFGCSRI